MSEWLGEDLLPGATLMASISFFSLALSQSLRAAPDSFSHPDTLWLARVFSADPPDSGFSSWRPLAFGGDRGETSYATDSVLGRRCLRARA